MEGRGSRYETNRQVRVVLVRHDVDLVKLGYSCSGNVAYFFGDLRKGTSDQFDPAQIETLVKDLMSLPGVRGLQFDILNWTITCDRGSIYVSKIKKAGSAQEPEQVVIERAETISEVLEDVKSK